jgi:transcriptional regulator GlxA family with amidase domain
MNCVRARAWQKMTPEWQNGHAGGGADYRQAVQGSQAMNRRSFVQQSIGVSLGMFAVTARARAAAASAAGSKAELQSLPKRDVVRVAFLLGDSANVIDTSAPWEVFQDVMLMDGNEHRHPFELFTVAPTEGILTMTGGLQVKPHYSIRNAPQPNLIVVPAHRATDDSRAWLREASAGTDVTMSVCTGAFQLARAGLFNKVAATTHHDYWDAFTKEFPDVELRRGLRFVDNGRIATAGGLTSGIDVALHVVARYFGVAAAQTTAEYMEYSSDAWRST